MFGNNKRIKKGPIQNPKTGTDIKEFLVVPRLEDLSEEEIIEWTQKIFEEISNKMKEKQCHSDQPKNT